MKDHSSNTNRIAKNTIALYCRTFITLVVSLYTSRIVLRELGITDYGIYNVIGGVVVLFTFMNSAMVSAVQRFLSFKIGQKDAEGERDIFNISILIHIGIAILVIVLAETVGLWFVNNKLSIPSDSYVAANWVYQFSVINIIIRILQIPYNACIIANEKMSFYAYLSIMESCGYLLVAFLLSALVSDRLVYYALMISLVVICVFFVYAVYCHRKFETCRFKIPHNKGLYRQLFSFSGWSVIGGFSVVCVQQGLGIIMNIFMGVVINAALGIVNQVIAGITTLISNLQTATHPQIIKSYAEKDIVYFNNLIFKSSKFSFFLLSIFVIPLFIYMDGILNIWLGVVPEYTSVFIRIMIFYTMIDALAGPFWIAIQATGRIKIYQILGSIIVLLNLPIAYVLLRMGISPVYVILFRVLINIGAYLFRVVYLRKIIDFDLGSYFNKVIIPVCLVSAVAWSISLIMANYCHVLLVVPTSFLLSVCSVYVLGMDSTERTWIKQGVFLQILKKIKSLCIL